MEMFFVVLFSEWQNLDVWLGAKVWIMHANIHFFLPVSKCLARSWFSEMPHRDKISPASAAAAATGQFFTPQCINLFNL
jgi:hypothetical protein